MFTSNSQPVKCLNLIVQHQRPVPNFATFVFSQENAEEISDDLPVCAQILTHQGEKINKTDMSETISETHCHSPFKHIFTF